MKKRTFIKLAGTAGAGLLLAPLAGCNDEGTESPQGNDLTPRPFLFEQEPLGYGFDALNPAIDGMTMEIHYGKHHAGYVTKLNRAMVAAGMSTEGLTVESLLSSITADQKALRNNGGGHYNHTLYWRTMAPGGSPMPEGDLRAELIGSVRVGRGVSRGVFSGRSNAIRQRLGLADSKQPRAIGSNEYTQSRQPLDDQHSGTVGSAFARS